MRQHEAAIGGLSRNARESLRVRLLGILEDEESSEAAQEDAVAGLREIQKADNAEEG